MVGPPLLLGQSVVLSESGMEVTGTDAVGYGISAIAERIFHVESPLTKQPLGDVDPIAIAFAPPSQPRKCTCIESVPTCEPVDRTPLPKRKLATWAYPNSGFRDEPYFIRKYSTPSFEITGANWPLRKRRCWRSCRPDESYRQPTQELQRA